jgi:thermitase
MLRKRVAHLALAFTSAMALIVSSGPAHAYIPNDPQIGQQDNLFPSNGAGVNAVAAWDRAKGDSSVFVAVLDTGIDISHQDITPNVFFFSDCPITPFGPTGQWDAINNRCSTVLDDVGQGTAMAGIIAGRGDNQIQIAGIGWYTGVVSIKVRAANQSVGALYTAMQRGIDKALALKQQGYNIKVIALGQSHTASSAGLKSKIELARSRGVAVVAGAGDQRGNTSSNPTYPCAYATLCVGATNNQGRMASWSAYGTTHVDVAEPGDQVLSAAPAPPGPPPFPPLVARRSGTAISAAHVAGTLALMAETGPCRTKLMDTLGTSDTLAKALLRGSPTRVTFPEGALPVAGGRLLNVRGALAAAGCS